MRLGAGRGGGRVREVCIASGIVVVGGGEVWIRKVLEEVGVVGRVEMDIRAGGVAGLVELLGILGPLGVE